MGLHYLVDGFNLLYALAEIPPGTWEEKRRRLLDLLQQRRPQGHNQLTVIFDSRQGFGDRQDIRGMEVIYTAGETADDWIIRHVREMPNARIAVVVTDDRGLQHLARGTGARILGTLKFLPPLPSPKTPRSHQPPPEALEDITDELKKEWLK